MDPTALIDKEAEYAGLAELGGARGDGKTLEPGATFDSDGRLSATVINKVTYRKLTWDDHNSACRIRIWSKPCKAFRIETSMESIEGVIIGSVYCGAQIIHRAAFVFGNVTWDGRVVLREHNYQQKSVKRSR